MSRRATIRIISGGLLSTAMLLSLAPTTTAAAANLTVAPLDLELDPVRVSKVHKAVVKSASTAFATRATSVQAGAVTVRATTVAGVKVEATAPYPAQSCN